MPGTEDRVEREEGQFHPAVTHAASGGSGEVARVHRQSMRSGARAPIARCRAFDSPATSRTRNGP